MVELTDEEIIDQLRYSDTKFGGRTFQEADRDHAFPRFWRSAYCDTYRSRQELAGAACDALEWLQLFQSAGAVRVLGARTGRLDAAKIDDNERRFADCVESLTLLVRGSK